MMVVCGVIKRDSLKKGKIRNEHEVRRTRKDWDGQREHWQREGGDNGVNERELDRKGGARQTADALWHSQRTEGETAARRRRRRRATAPSTSTPSPTASLQKQQEETTTPPGSTAAPAGPMQDCTEQEPLHSPGTTLLMLSSSFLTWPERISLVFLVVHHGSLAEGCERDPAARDRGQLEPLGAVAALLDDLEDTRTDGGGKARLPLENRYRKHQLENLCEGSQIQ